MNIASSKCDPRPATRELVTEILSDYVKRGDGVVMGSGDDNCIMLNGDEEDGFTLEYKEGDKLFRSKGEVALKDAEAAFLEFLDGNTSWRTRWQWEELSGLKMRLVELVPTLVKIGALAAIVAAYLLISKIFG